MLITVLIIIDTIIIIISFFSLLSSLLLLLLLPGTPSTLTRPPRRASLAGTPSAICSYSYTYVNSIIIIITILI